MKIYQTKLKEKMQTGAQFPPMAEGKGRNLIFIKKFPMSLLNQKNQKGKGKDDKKSKSQTGQGSKFIQKPKSGFVSTQQNTGSQRGS
jgi:hypothetical protein